MKERAFLRWLQLVLVLCLGCRFAFTAAAQNYYPADIGNTWVLESTDGTQQKTYTLEGPETVEGKALVLLKITNEEFRTGEMNTDKYFVAVDDEGLKLHSVVLENAIALLTGNFPTPVIFFPMQFVLGDKWQIVADAKAKPKLGPAISGKSTTNLEVIAFEDVVTPTGTFQNCAKVQLDLRITALFLKLDSTTYQWLAPDVGPVKYQNSDGLIFELVSTNLPIGPEVPDTAAEADTPETPPYDVTDDGVINILDLTFVASRFGEADSDADVTGDGRVNILDLVLIAQHFGN